MDGIYRDGMTAHEAVAGLIRASHSGLCSGEPHGVGYPGVPDAAGLCEELGLDPAAEITEDQFVRAAERIDPDSEC